MREQIVHTTRHELAIARTGVKAAIGLVDALRVAGFSPERTNRFYPRGVEELESSLRCLDEILGPEGGE